MLFRSGTGRVEDVSTANIWEHLGETRDLGTFKVPDLKAKKIVESLLVWLYFLPGSYYFGVILNYGFIAPWLFFGSYLLFFAVAMVWKIKQGDWKKINI